MAKLFQGGVKLRQHSRVAEKGTQVRSATRPVEGPTVREVYSQIRDDVSAWEARSISQQSKKVV